MSHSGTETLLCLLIQALQEPCVIVTSKNHTKHKWSLKWHRNNIKKPQSQDTYLLRVKTSSFGGTCSLPKGTRASLRRYRQIMPRSRVPDIKPTPHQTQGSRAQGPKGWRPHVPPPHPLQAYEPSSCSHGHRSVCCPKTEAQADFSGSDQDAIRGSQRYPGLRECQRKGWTHG